MSCRSRCAMLCAVRAQRAGRFHKQAASERGRGEGLGECVSAWYRLRRPAARPGPAALRMAAWQQARRCRTGSAMGGGTLCALAWLAGMAGHSGGPSQRIAAHGGRERGRGGLPSRYHAGCYCPATGSPMTVTGWVPLRSVGGVHQGARACQLGCGWRHPRVLLAAGVCRHGSMHAGAATARTAESGPRGSPAPKPARGEGLRACQWRMQMGWSSQQHFLAKL